MTSEQQRKSADPPAAAAPAASAAAAPGRGRWFACNLILLALLAPFATYWFQQHLQFYFTGIVLVGGGITVWAFLRLVLAVLEKVGKVDPLEYSRRWLASPEATLLLVVAILGLLVLWLTTTSLYFEYAGGGRDDRDFVVRVVQTADGAPYLADTAVGPGNRVAGQAFLFVGKSAPLTCSIVKPLRYEPRPCAVEVGKSTRVRVPEGFKAKTYHLLRIVPSPDLYRELPRDTDEPQTRYTLHMSVDGTAHTFDDLRRQTVFAGGMGADMALVQDLDNPESYERFLGASLRSFGFEEQPSLKMAATLALSTKEWGVFEARKGQKLQFVVRQVARVDGKEQATDVENTAVTHTVTGDKVQTIWIPAPKR